MPDPAASDRARDRIHALSVMCVLAIASVVIAVLGATPARVSSSELMGEERTPGDAAFIASHRGGAATAPENTLPAVTAALEAGFDYVEVDIALTADGHPVLMHDKSVDRTTDGRGRLASLTLAEVRALDAGSWFDAVYAGTRVPTFTEFLDVLVAADARAIVELKGGWDAAAIDAAVAEVAARGLERRVVFASFDAMNVYAADGTFLDTNSGNPVTQSAHFGYWRHIRGNKYEFAQRFFVFDAAGVTTGSRIVRHQVVLDRTGLSFTSGGYAETFNTDGVLLATGCSTSTAVRFD